MANSPDTLMLLRPGFGTRCYVRDPSETVDPRRGQGIDTTRLTGAGAGISRIVARRTILGDQISDLLREWCFHHS